MTSKTSLRQQLQANIAFTPVVLPYAATVSINAALGQNFYIGNLTGNITLNATNGIDGKPLSVRLRQDTTGGRTLTLGSMFALPLGFTLSPVTTANTVTILTFRYDTGLTKFLLVDFDQY